VRLHIALGAIAVALHHAIVLKEERFLAATQGDEFREYTIRAGRYILIV
jgi:protein-S-isoprenylcysteine O-methyltransferase Ste14